MKTLFTLLTILAALHCGAQEITGTIQDKQARAIRGATVTILQGGTVRGRATTGADGAYTVKPLGAGFYDLQVTAPQMAPYTETRIVVTPDQPTMVNCTLPLQTTGTAARDTVHLSVGSHMVNRNGPDVNVLQRNDIYNMPYTNLNDAVSTMPGVRQARRGDAISIQGSQPGGVAYYEDGVRVMR